MDILEYDPTQGEQDNVNRAIQHLAKKLYPKMPEPEPYANRWHVLFEILRCLDIAIEAERQTATKSRAAKK